ncbi:MAG: PQQ-binding-like beta-propeller repeat protein [Verrucomicrobia bacterium]|nr:PQQ-binding-like beta-propeller repeat protein [Verrucomicrobiota bacterium]
MARARRCDEDGSQAECQVRHRAVAASRRFASRRGCWRLVVGLTLAVLGLQIRAADQPQWGQAWSRNMVSEERHLPDTFDPATGKNIRWSAPLGTESHSTPVVAGGRIYIGTNNGQPRDSKQHGDRGVLMCFEEKTGKFLWQLVVPKRSEDPYMDWPNAGISSPATVEGDRVYIVSNRGEVMCLDARGMANGNQGPFRDEGAHMTPPADAEAPPKAVAGANIEPQLLRPRADGMLLQPGPTDADIIWLFDLVAEAGIWPHDAAHSSILLHGDYLYLNSGTGVDNTHRRIRRPDAPSLVVLDKSTGRYVARDDEPIAPDIFHSTWSSPSLAVVNGRALIFFCGGNGVVYAFAALDPDAGSVLGNPSSVAAGNSASAINARHRTGGAGVRRLKKVWQFDFDPTAPKENVHAYLTNRREGPSNIYGMPVCYRNRVYVAGGGDVFWGKNQAWLKCIDATQTGDITVSGLVWSYRLERHVLGTPAISQGMVFIADCGRKLHCVDAETGKPYWTADITGDAWASPLVADGKVYLGTRSGNFYVFGASRTKQLLSAVELGNPISATVTAANGTVYIATMSRLYAVQDQDWLGAVR